MNLASLDFALSHIGTLVEHLTKKTYKQAVADINHLTTIHGQEAERHLIRWLFSLIDFGGDGKSSNGKDVYQIQLLQHECAALIAKSNCASILCYAIDFPLSRQKTLKPSPHLLSQISKILKLNKLQEVVFGVILLNSSNPELRIHAKTFTRLKFPDLISSFLDTEAGGRESGLHEAPVDVLHHILIHLVDADNSSGTSSELREQFLAALRREFPRERTPVVLVPLLYAEKFNSTIDQLNPTSISLPRSVMETTLADSLREIGYSCTTDKDRCRQTLTQLGGVREVTAKAVAQVLGMMARTITGLQEGLHMQTLNMPNSLWVAESRPDGQHQQQISWNVDVFVQVVQELSPSLNWRDVVKELDHPGFLVTSKHGLQLVVMAVRKALHGSFPVEELYKVWENSEGQLSWFIYALNNPDVFCFANFQRQHISLDMLKAPPDDDNIDIATWKSSELVETLLRLSDLGHYQQISELFKFPVQHCPDLLVINLLQTTIAWNTLKRELFISLIPMFLGTHPNSGSVLQFVWNCQAHVHSQLGLLRTLVMFCMADWYMRGGDPNDQTRLSRILDVAQDLKALSMLLNVSQFTFVVDLACLASRREYLKLDKWLSDKIRDHGESFIDAVVMFLKRRCPALIGFKDDAHHQQAKGQLSPETIGTLLAILQNYLGNIRSEEIAKDINMMISHAGPLLNKPRTIQSMPPMLGMPGATGGQPASTIENSFNSMPNLPGLQAATPGGSPAKFNQPNGGAPIVAGMPGAAPTAMQNLQNVRHIPPPPARSMPSTMPAPPAAQEMPFSQEVEDEANAYFQKIYNQPPNQLTIEEVLEMLKSFKDSNIRREREVFSCMLRNLFEENRFFPQYPDRELHITALLFGGIIEQGLVQHMALGLALKFVLEALKQEPNSKMHMFGLAALDKFKARLKDCGQYCQHIVAIPHFGQFPSVLIEYVNYGKAGKEPPMTNIPPPMPAAAVLPPAAASHQVSQPMPAASNAPPPAAAVPVSNAQRPAGVIGLPSGKVAKPSLAHTTNIDTLLAGADDRQELSVPPEATQDRVFFIFNNLSQLNMPSKADELLQALQDEYVAWTAQYLVMKRASIEPNFHPLYSGFLDALKKAPLNKRVLLETFRNIKVLLRTDKGVSNFSDRSLLKNLGHWLGLITLAKNKPILQLDLDLKALLYEANSKGSEELLYVVPFVAKVLESCEKSRIFRPPNPWTVGILSVLCELHQQPDLKLNLKFEIEVLCKNLHLEIQEIAPTMCLTDAAFGELIESQLARPKEEPQVILNVSMPRGAAVGAPEMDPSGGQPQMVPGAQPQINVRSSPQPSYSYNDIKVDSLASLAPHIQASDHIPLFQFNKNLKPLVRPVLERSISELLGPVVEKSIKIAITLCENIIKKDFSLDPEEQRMMGAAHHIVRGMTAGMALITCRDPLLISIQAGLKQVFMNQFRGTNVTVQQKEMIEHAAQLIAQDNMELASAYIQKSAVEKAIPEIDKRLASEFESRLTARQEGRRYIDPVAQRYQMEMMPEPIRLKPGGAAPNLMSVYEEFARNIPGFAMSNSANLSDLLGQTQQNMHSKQHISFLADEISSLYEKIAIEIENQLKALASSLLPQHTAALQSLLESLKNGVQSRDTVAMTAVTLLQKTLDSFLENYNSSISDASATNRFRDCHILILKGLQGPRAFGAQWTNKHVTRYLIECRDELKYSSEEAIECLVKASLLNLQQYDVSLATSMENGMNYNAVALAMKLVQKLIVDEKGNDQVTESDLANTLETLAKISTVPRHAPEGLPALIEAIRLQNDGGLLPGAASGPTSMMQSGINQAKDTNDPQWLLDKTEFLLREWVHMYHHPSAGGRDASKTVFTQFITQMQNQGILKSDELITRFFRLCTQLCVDITYSTLKTFGNNQALIRAQCFKTLDAYVRLIVLLVKLSGDASNTLTKINLLNKVLGIVTGVLLIDHEMKGKEFQQLPFHRIFIMLFIELNAPEHILESINFQVLTAFVNTYRILRPAKVPGFAFAWLELISHRAFIGRMLQLTAQQRGWNLYAQLLIDLFKFLAPFLRNADLNRAMQVLYKGTLRVLLVLLHDFPEFLCDYHYAFCDVIPSNCIQMRNLILSAFPRNMRLPDPFTPNLKVDMLTEIAHAPKIMTNIPAIIQPETFKKDLDSYLKTRSPATFPAELRSNLQITDDPGNQYNIPLMNALVLYVGTQAIQSIQGKGMSPSTSTIAQSSHMDIFQSLADRLDTEGRYLFLNAITNQLRFPNSHTHYFSCALLSLFAEAPNVALQEQITRVLLERLIVNRPHPWGLLVTFIELIRNQSYKFWGHEFVHCSPEIERLFETVARSCNQNRSQQPTNVAPPSTNRPESGDPSTM